MSLTMTFEFSEGEGRPLSKIINMPVFVKVCSQLFLRTLRQCNDKADGHVWKDYIKGVVWSGSGVRRLDLCEIVLTRSTRTVHTSAKARLTSVAIRIRIDTRINHFCSLAHCQPSLKISRKSVGKFLRKVANRQTNDDYITSLAELITVHLKLSDDRS